MIIKTITAVITLCIGTQIAAQSNGGADLKAIETSYKAAKVLAFDGNIKYYTDIQNTNPSEMTLMSYRRDGDKMHLVIGTQTVIYDGKLNLIINEDEQTIYVSATPPKQVKKGSKALPTEGFEQYAETGLFDIQATDYVGNKRKVSIKSKDDKATASTVEFIYQPSTNFIEFTRMIVDRVDESLSADINKKKFECSYYNYKTSLSEKITTDGYLEKVKSGKKFTFKGIGKFKNYQIITV